MRAFVHDVVNPIAAIRISVGALRARAKLTERETSDISRIEDAARTIIGLVTNLGPLPERGPGPPDEPALAPSVDLYVVCCEIVAARRFADGTVIHCRAFGDPRGSWDREQVGRVVSSLLDHAIAHLGQRAPMTVAVTGMARHVRVDVHGLGRLSASQRETALDVWATMEPAPPGAMLSAIAAPGGGIILRLRLPRRRVTPQDNGPDRPKGAKRF